MVLFSCIVSFAITLFCISWLRPLAIRVGLVDVPSYRKQHRGHVPLIGGLAMFCGFLSGLLTLPISLQNFRSFIAANALLVFVGLLDDFKELSARMRFLAQIGATCLMFFWGDVGLHHLGNLFFYKNIVLNHLSLIVTSVAVLGIINAVNMTDGIDGLAGLLALIQLFWLTLLALITAQWITVPILLLFIASLLAFLCFNFPFSLKQAKIFMGDAGSTLLGFVLVWFLINLSQTTEISPVTMLWIMAVPLFDTTRMIIYRMRAHKPVCTPDRAHLHHLLLGIGLSVNQVVMIIGGMSVLSGLVGLFGFFLNISESILFLSFLTTFGLYYVSVDRLSDYLAQYEAAPRNVFIEK